MGYIWELPSGYVIFHGDVSRNQMVKPMAIGDPSCWRDFSRPGVVTHLGVDGGTMRFLGDQTDLPRSLGKVTDG